VNTPIGHEVLVPPDLVHPNPWNPNKMDDFMFGKTTASLDKLGFAAPIVVRDMGDYYEVIDGEHRLRAAIELGMEQVPIWTLGYIPDAKAKQLTVVLNETRGQANREQLGELLKDLMISETTADLLAILPYERPDFEALLNVPDFDWGDIDELTRPPDASRDRMRWVERIYRMPPEVAEVIDQAISRVKDREEDQGKIEDWRALELICADYLAR
jgi:ParB-like chromosome segregation protein Spo0J